MWLDIDSCSISLILSCKINSVCECVLCLYSLFHNLSWSMSVGGYPPAFLVHIIFIFIVLCSSFSWATNRSNIHISIDKQRHKKRACNQFYRSQLKLWLLFISFAHKSCNRIDVHLWSVQLHKCLHKLNKYGKCSTKVKSSASNGFEFGWFLVLASSLSAGLILAFAKEKNLKNYYHLAIVYLKGIRVWCDDALRSDHIVAKRSLKSYHRMEIVEREYSWCSDRKKTPYEPIRRTRKKWQIKEICCEMPSKRIVITISYRRFYLCTVSY